MIDLAGFDIFIVFSPVDRFYEPEIDIVDDMEFVRQLRESTDHVLLSLCPDKERFVVFQKSVRADDRAAFPFDSRLFVIDMLPFVVPHMVQLARNPGVRAFNVMVSQRNRKPVLRIKPEPGKEAVRSKPHVVELADLFVDRESLPGNALGQFRMEPDLVAAEVRNGLVLPPGHGRSCVGKDLLIVIVKVLHLVKCREPFAVDGSCAV